MGGYSQQFGADLLKALGYRATSENLKFLAAWARAEGGSASYNPFNTTEKWSGATSYNSVGVRNYASYQDGLNATIATLRNGRYGGILSGLQSGASAMSTAQALAASPWGTGSLVEKVLGGGGSLSASSASVQPVGGAADKLDIDTLAQQYGWDAAFLRSIPELSHLFTQAMNDPTGQWTPAKFVAKLEQTTWWKHNSASARTAILQASKDPATFAASVAAKQTDIQDLAGQMGASLSAAALAGLARRAYTTGMDDNQVKAALSAYINYGAHGTLGGDAGSVADQLNQLAYANGVKLNSSYVLNAARQVEAGTATPENAAQYIRTLAAGAFPQFAAQIKGGQNMADIASPYTNAMSTTLEMDPAKVDLFDPTIRRALMGTADPKSCAVAATPLWQFEQTLKEDPRWQQTDNARESLMGVAHNILQQWGVQS